MKKQYRICRQDTFVRFNLHLIFPMEWYLETEEEAEKIVANLVIQNPQSTYFIIPQYTKI